MATVCPGWRERWSLPAFNSFTLRQKREAGGSDGKYIGLLHRGPIFGQDPFPSGIAFAAVGKDRFCFTPQGRDEKIIAAAEEQITLADETMKTLPARRNAL